MTTKTEEMEACPLAEFGARPCTSNSDYVVIHLLPKNGETVKYRLSAGGAALLADELRGSIRRPTVPEGLVETLVKTFRQWLSDEVFLPSGYTQAEPKLAERLRKALSPASHERSELPADLPEFCLNVMRAQLATFGVEPACNVDGALSVLRSTPAPEALREAFAKRAGTTVVAGGGELPHCKVYFETVDDAHAFDAALPRETAALRTEGKPS